MLIEKQSANSAVAKYITSVIVLALCMIATTHNLNEVDDLGN